jgi:toxin ParE1/3/4
MVELIWSPTAVKDIGNIAEYIAKDSLKAANLQTNRFFEKTEILENYPLIGSFVPELNDKNYRQLLVNSYRIIYKIISDTEVHILTVHHQARLLENNPVFKRKLKKK